MEKRDQINLNTEQQLYIQTEEMLWSGLEEGQVKILNCIGQFHANPAHHWKQMGTSQI